MSNLNKLEFINSVRNPKVWQMCLAMIGLTLFLFPGEQAGYAVIDINGFRGIYNAEWMGESLALVSSWLLLLVGFYFVVGDITQARKTGVLALLLSSRLTVTKYLGLKFLNRLTLLLGVCACMVITALVQQQFLGESVAWDPVAYLFPFLTLLLPVAVLVSSFSVLFEVVPKLRGKACNAAYFVVWSVLGMVNLVGFSAHSAITEQMEKALGQSSGPLSGSISIGLSPVESAQQTFIWHGAVYDSEVLAAVALQILAGLVVLLMAVLLANKKYSLLSEHHARHVIKATARRPVVDGVKSMLAKALLLPGLRFSALTAELRVLLAELSAKQLLGFASVSLLACLVSEPVFHKLILPFAAILPLFLLAQMSTRDINSGTMEIVHATCSPEKLLFNRWLAAVIFLFVAYLGLLLRNIVTLDVVALLHVVAFICVAPLLALLSAYLFRSNKPYELLYLTAWFAGPLNKQQEVDFIGVSGSHSAMLGTWITFLLVSGVLAVLFFHKGHVWQRQWKWLKLNVS